MKPDTARNRNIVGYLLSFLLGVLCLGVAVLIFRREKPPAALRADTGPLKESSEQPRALPPSRREVRSIPAAEFAEENISQPPQEPAESSPSQTPARREIVQVRPGPVPSPPLRALDSNPYHITAANTRIAGRATLHGEPPPETPIPLEPHCASIYPNGATTRRYLLGHDRGLANVLISLQINPASATASATNLPPRVIAFEKCFLEPYISAVQIGQRVLLRNQSPVLHHPVLQSASNQFNKAFLPKNPDFEFTFNQPEEVRFRCEVHPWEFAYINVVPHPFFAVTDQNGNYQIHGMPPGEYTLQAHHRKAGLLQKTITVQTDHATTTNFDFQAPPALASDL